MALGRQQERQTDMLVSWAELPRSPGHIFYDRLQAVLISAGFDGFVEGVCAPLYAAQRGRPSLPAGRYFRMLLIGYFECIDSERGLEWRCADSLSLREFLRLSEREGVPDHSWLSRTRSRLPLELHDQVFTWAELPKVPRAKRVEWQRRDCAVWPSMA
jgi:transposase